MCLESVCDKSQSLELGLSAPPVLMEGLKAHQKSLTNLELSFIRT